ncbi:T9SS type A sorting domain-containing protein [Flavobacterium sp. N2270]|uniref:Ig-like domain-containing protein n=1 Tax=Flavobacterium sp. N2270 TaxID=2986831 RepID=UPI002225576A|nr:T9SS type A sorting domain-containing protein [Flavobacterium sp. N2270]
MKTTKINKVVFILLLLLNGFIYAQYNGGDADGQAFESLNNTSCSLPDQFYAYNGGSGSLTTSNGLSNTTCSIPDQFYAYNGGNADGAASETINAVACGNPDNFYAYFGGNADGAASETINAITCGYPDQFYAYFGGNADGFSVSGIDAISCPEPAQFYAYFGGDADGFSAETVDQVTCAIPPQFYAYFGGIDDGFSVGNTAPVCPTDPPVADFTASATTICVGESITFTDTSTNLPFVWSWTFTGGTPSSSTDQNPVITYNTAGTYEVELVATNFNGSDTETKTAFITVSAYPTITGTTPAARCDAGTVTLQATASTGTISWFANATGGTALGTGTSFTTPSLSTTTTYYVEVANNGCISGRTAVIATINTTPTISGTTPASRCGSGTVTLQATASAGTIQWFTASTGGTVLFTGANYTTPSLTTTTSYYVQVSQNGCTSPRTEVIATINEIPTITGTTPASRCDSGTVTLQATASIGTISWYTASSGGTALGTGTSFTTPSLSTTTTYYVESATATCNSTRTAVTATVNATPSITSTTPSSVCDAGTVTLQATASTGTISWFANATGGTALGTGTSFTTPSLSTTTTYYVEVTNNGCTSSRTAVIATINTTPTITGTTPANRCGSGTVTLQATASAGTIQWFAASTGGTVLFTGANYTTPSLGTTTSYYVQVSQNGCTSSRTEVIATINEVPTITSTTPSSVCNSGTVTLQATASTGTISWYAAASGGSALGTGTSFTTPVLSTSTTYYVESANTTCNSTRTAVTASVTNTSAPTGNANQTYCAGETVANILVSGTNIIWYDASTGGNIVLGTDLIADGIYYASQTISGCESATRLAITMSTGGCLSNDDFVQALISMYPNPVQDILNIKSSVAIERVEIHNLLGQIIFNSKYNNEEVRIDFSNYATGTYLIRVFNDNNPKTYKIIKK